MSHSFPTNQQLQKRQHTKHSLFTSCMVFFVLWSRGLVTSARAWSTIPLVLRSSPKGLLSGVTTRNISQRGGSISTTTSGLSLSNTAPDPESPKKPRTGWNHNLPSSKSSESSSAQPQQDNSDEEPKTGWLHNTKAPSQGNEANIKAGGISKAQRRLKQAMKQQQRNHRMVSPPTFHACESGRRLVVTEHTISFPIHRSKKKDKAATATTTGGDDRIDVYFTITEKVGTTTKDEKWWQSLVGMTPLQRATAYVLKANLKNANGLMLYLQGGPGFGAPTPMVDCGLTKGSSWAAAALDDYPRIVLMDQRGTGRSTPVTKQSLERKFPDLFSMDDVAEEDEISQDKVVVSESVKDALEKATEYMAALRADNIVQDAEEIRDALLVPSEAVQDDEPRPWGAALGQSFGGFCMMTYLSQVAHPPKICLLTGGIAPMLTPVYDAYDMLWDRVKERSLRYYEMYPGDIQVVKKIVERLLYEPPVLPSGGKLTARRFLQLGLGLGGNPSAFASLHTLFSTAFLSNDDHDGKPEFTRAFLKHIDSAQSFDDHPIYFLLHESIYADGPRNNPTQWAAHRVYEDRVKTPSEFDYKLTSHLHSDDRPTLFFGEMVFPWMADGDFAEVSGTGMKLLASALAEKNDWGPLYDGAHMKKVLKDGSISKAAAAVYLEDMYVEFNACMEVTKRGGPLEKCKIWVTNYYQHSGLRDGGASIYEKLMGMANGSIRTPS